MRRILLIGVLALTCSGGLPEICLGHVFPDHADPRIGATVPSPPARVAIWFDGDLEPAFCKIMVHDASGKVVDKADGKVDPSDPKLLSVSVPPLPPGSYLVMWIAVGRDGHRTSGQYRFTVK